MFLEGGEIGTLAISLGHLPFLEARPQTKQNSHQLKAGWFCAAQMVSPVLKQSQTC